MTPAAPPHASSTATEQGRDGAVGGEGRERGEYVGCGEDEEEGVGVGGEGGDLAAGEEGEGRAADHALALH
eukprot:204263-Rhodomonas_salina.1